LGNIFGNAASRPSSPDKFFKVEKEVKREKKKG
jgi:hypothetical protein